MTIRQSENYDMFGFINGNRDTSITKIEKIAADVRGGMNMLPYFPILVNKDYLIIDGQHRFEVSRATQNPVYYLVVHDVPIGKIAMLNSRSSNWRMRDYLECYVKCGIDDYKVLARYLKKYQGISISDMMAILELGSIQIRRDSEAFKNGKFKAKETKAARDLMEFVWQFNYHHLWKKRPFILAMEKILKAGKYEEERLLASMKRDFDAFMHSSNWKDYLSQIERAYNFRLRERVVLV